MAETLAAEISEILPGFFIFPLLISCTRWQAQPTTCWFGHGSNNNAFPFSQRNLLKVRDGSAAALPEV